MSNIHIGIASMKQFQCVPTTYVIENRETILKFTLTKYHGNCLLNISNSVPISIEMPATILQNVYIHMIFELMKYFFANLVVAWL